MQRNQVARAEANARVLVRQGQLLLRHYPVNADGSWHNPFEEEASTLSTAVKRTESAKILALDAPECIAKEVGRVHEDFIYESIFNYRLKHAVFPDPAGLHIGPGDVPRFQLLQDPSYREQYHRKALYRLNRPCPLLWAGVSAGGRFTYTWEAEQPPQGQAAATAAADEEEGLLEGYAPEEFELPEPEGWTARRVLGILRSRNPPLSPPPRKEGKPETVSNRHFRKPPHDLPAPTPAKGKQLAVTPTLARKVVEVGSNTGARPKEPRTAAAVAVARQATSQPPAVASGSGVQRFSAVDARYLDKPSRGYVVTGTHVVTFGSASDGAGADSAPASATKAADPTSTTKPAGGTARADPPKRTTRFAAVDARYLDQPSRGYVVSGSQKIILGEGSGAAGGAHPEARGAEAATAEEQPGPIGAAAEGPQEAAAVAAKPPRGSTEWWLELEADIEWESEAL